MPSSTVERETIEIESSADEMPLVELSSSQGSSFEAEPDVIQRDLEVTNAPFTSNHATVGGVPLDETIGPSALNDPLPSRLSLVIRQNASSDNGVKIMQLKEPALPSTVTPVPKTIPSTSFIDTYDDFESGLVWF